MTNYVIVYITKPAANGHHWGTQNNHAWVPMAGSTTRLTFATGQEAENWIRAQGE